MIRRRLLLLGLAVGLGWFLVQLGRGDLGVPLTSWQGLRRWLDAATPTMVAVAILRLAGLALCAYLATILIAGSVASAVGWRRAATASLRMLPLTLRRALTGSAGLSLATGTMLSPLSAAALARQPDQDGTATMEKLEPGATSTTSTTSTTVPTTTTAPPDHTTDPRPPSPTERTEAGDRDVWLVESGDSFWSIADELLTEHSLEQTGAPPSEAAIARYWQALIAANRDRLADPDNSDLLFPGQELVIPARS